LNGELLSSYANGEDEMKKKERSKFYFESGHFSAIGRFPGDGVSIALRQWFKDSEDGPPLITSSCVSVSELTYWIDLLISQLTKIKKNSRKIMDQVDEDHDAAMKRFGRRK
jgi:hypothetical protein